MGLYQCVILETVIFKFTILKTFKCCLKEFHKGALFLLLNCLGAKRTGEEMAWGQNNYGLGRKWLGGKTTRAWGGNG